MPKIDLDAVPGIKGSSYPPPFVNRSQKTAMYLEVGSRVYDDLTTCSDIDMMSANADGRFVRKDGMPFER
jgi:uncharacterized cupin superfamily protein